MFNNKSWQVRLQAWGIVVMLIAGAVSHWQDVQMDKELAAIEKQAPVNNSSLAWMNHGE